MEVVLSSGYLAFARHVGFLRAVEESGVDVERVCGTSSGALVGSLWAAGWSLQDIQDELLARRPLRSVGLHLRPWRGLFSLTPFLDRLRQLLPPRFEDLARPLAVGVTRAGDRHQLIDDGPLPEAVAASCAVPWLFAPLCLGGQWTWDGGASDRLGLGPWLAERDPAAPVLVHNVAATLGREQTAQGSSVWMVRSPRSQSSLWGLAPWEPEAARSQQLAQVVLAAALAPGDECATKIG